MEKTHHAYLIKGLLTAYSTNKITVFCIQVLFYFYRLVGGFSCIFFPFFSQKGDSFVAPAERCPCHRFDARTNDMQQSLFSRV